MSYQPSRPPDDPKGLAEFLRRELSRISAALMDDAETVQYMTPVENALSMTEGVSANWKIPFSNLVRISASNTITLTGIADKTPRRARTILQVGSGVVVFKSEGTESSESYRFALAASTLELSQNASVTLWYDPYSFRHRVI